MTDNIYQLKITLNGSKPPIWRRVLVNEDITLEQLHTVIQISMGWENYHLHRFVHNNVFYDSDPVEEIDNLFGDSEDEARCRLNTLLTTEKNSMIYEYDFGDDWEHRILLEKILPFSKDQQ